MKMSARMHVLCELRDLRRDDRLADRRQRRIAAPVPVVGIRQKSSREGGLRRRQRGNDLGAALRSDARSSGRRLGCGSGGRDGPLDRRRRGRVQRCGCSC